MFTRTPDYLERHGLKDTSSKLNEEVIDVCLLHCIANTSPVHQWQLVKSPHYIVNDW